MELRQAFLAMIKAFPGGWGAMCGALGYSRDGLENRVYERKGQGVSVHVALQMQEFSGTTHFAETIAQMSGGVFLRLPSLEHLDDDELLAKFNDLYAELGKLSGDFRHAVKDGEIDRKEREQLEDDAQCIHRTLEQLLALARKVYCRSAEAA